MARRDIGDLRYMDLTRHDPCWWAGDVWKVVLVLKRYRPDLKIRAFDSAPTGLVVVTGLDPASTALSNAYFDIVQNVAGYSLSEHGDQYMRGLNLIRTESCTSPQSLSSMFWL
jgi:hypothetical protein